ncbi:hypothetical protein Nepgr_018786 [Nepenthes gracilis]|uniref:Uncharacterized protein n=1 Tax=Nepenthes gracilis TaxID=150966 RepID=A0AAD3SU29_NEPGR|nr:hypothetical protein Nepgr_018786 [Nepenthes gracilis]
MVFCDWHPVDAVHLPGMDAFIFLMGSVSTFPGMLFADGRISANALFDSVVAFACMGVFGRYGCDWLVLPVWCV